MKIFYRSILMLFWMSCSLASQEDSNTSDAVDINNQFMHAVNTHNKAKILAYSKQDPSVLFSLVDSDDVFEKPDTIIRIFTIMKKAGVNLNYQDNDGNNILHLLVDQFIDVTFTMPFIMTLIGNIASACNRWFTGENDKEHLQEDAFLSESEFITVTKNAQKILKSLLKLGIKKHVKNHDHETAADILKSYIDEMESDRAGNKKAFIELDKLYTMLK